MKCEVRIINGTSDHIHILLLLPKETSIAKLVKSIKGESSHWINQNDIIKLKFSWQVGYGAFSVSQSELKKVEAYIRNQEAHHKKMTFKDEYDRFLKLYKLKPKS